MLKFLSITLLVAFTLSCYQCEESTKDVERRLREDEIIPDVLQKLSDVKYLKVTYPSGVSADLGNILTPTQVKDEPKVEYEADSKEFFTLLMTDPDAPSRKEPSRREFRHWLVVNIPGNQVEKGETVWQFIGSGPPQVCSSSFFACYNFELFFIFFRAPVSIAMCFCSSNNREESNLMDHTSPITRLWEGRQHQQELSSKSSTWNSSLLTFTKPNMMSM
jgi:Phosphatidylethanolamine-binding protein